jgi:hypothetical protein
MYVCNFPKHTVLLAEVETVLQGVSDRLIEIGGCCAMEINVNKTKVMSITREAAPFHIMIDQNLLENVEYFNCLGSMITNNARCTRAIKSGIAMTNAAFSRKKTFFASKLDVN